MEHDPMFAFKSVAEVTAMTGSIQGSEDYAARAERHRTPHASLVKAVGKNKQPNSGSGPGPPTFMKAVFSVCCEAAETCHRE